MGRRHFPSARAFRFNNSSVSEMYDFCKKVNSLGEKPLKAAAKTTRRAFQISHGEIISIQGLSSDYLE